MDFLQKLQLSGNNFIDSIRGLVEHQPTTLNFPPPPTQAPTVPEIGMPHDQFNQQVTDMQNNGSTLQNVHRAIDLHPQITDKSTAKSMAQNIFENVGRIIPQALPAPFQIASELQQGRSIPEAIKNTYTGHLNPDIMNRANEFLTKGYSPTIARSMAQNEPLVMSTTGEQGSIAKKILIGTAVGLGGTLALPAILDKIFPDNQKDFVSGIIERADKGDFKGAEDALKLIKNKEDRDTLRNYIFRKYQKNQK